MSVPTWSLPEAGCFRVNEEVFRARDNFQPAQER